LGFTYRDGRTKQVAGDGETRKLKVELKNGRRKRAEIYTETATANAVSMAERGIRRHAQKVLFLVEETDKET
jgi:RNA:NAD 2'-phosphotransferase (TPT1/KptA family)